MASTAEDLFQQLSQAKAKIDQLQNMGGPLLAVQEVNALLQQAGTGRYDGELGAAVNALQEFAAAMQQLGNRVAEHMTQTRALMNG